MTYLVDTNVVSELRKPYSRGDAGVRRWAAETPTISQHVSVITVLELEIGVARVERRDARQGEALRRWLEDRVLVAFEHRILPIDVEVARRAAGLQVPDPCPDRDVLIAASGLVHGLTVVTRNVKDFVGTGVRTLNPWE